MIKLATVFSGIGSIEWALKRLKIPHKLVFACDNGERYLKEEFEEIKNEVYGLDHYETKKYIDNRYDKTGKRNFVQESYTANYEISPEDFYQDVRFLDGNFYKGQVDLFVGGSPCQSFSISGKRAGLEDARGTLFYEYARLVKEIQPKVFIYENVPGMLSHDKGNTFKTICDIFDSLGYDWKMDKLNSKDYGIPQNRTRLFIVGFRKDLNINDFNFPQKMPLEKVVKDYLETDIDKKYFHGEKGFKWITMEKSLKKRVSINSDISRTQAANQQFNWCGDMIFRPIELEQWAKEDERVYIGKYNGIEGVARKLTPRECLRLMGYDDDFKIVVPDQQMYRQCGNSIVVNVLEEIFKEVVNTGVFKKSVQHKIINVATVFSGIGSIEWALKRMNIDHNIIFACDNGDIEVEIDDEEKLRDEIKKIKTADEQNEYIRNIYEAKRKTNFVKQTYLNNYELDEKDFLYDVRFIDGTKYKGQVDLFVGGSPCQSFSIMGHQRGLDDTRGTLFYDYARLVKEIEPKVFIYENVQGMLKHDGGNTWNVIYNTFLSLGYKIYYKLLDSKDYGIPQTRRRVFVVGFKEDINEFEFPIEKELKFTMQDFLESNVRYGGFESIEGNIKLRKDKGEIDDKHFLSEKVLKHVMSPGTKGYYVKPEIDLEIARPLLSTMHKMHRAGVDNYVTLDGKIRRLTPRECLRLMGYDDTFKQVVSDTQMYKQAGNSIVVDVMISLMESIIKAYPEIIIEKNYKHRNINFELIKNENEEIYEQIALDEI